MCPKCNLPLTEKNYCFSCEEIFNSDSVAEEVSEYIFEPVDEHFRKLSETGDLTEAFSF